jgi:iron complex outermembrane recepter protein
MKKPRRNRWCSNEVWNGVARVNMTTYFLSGAARYRFTEDLMGIVSYSESIQRSNLTNMTGVATINDDNMSGSIPNPDLLPEHGQNYSARLEYYFQSVGVIAAGVFMSDITDLQFQRTQTPAEEIGLGEEYPGYLFTSWGNAGKFKVEGFELEYSQQLTFLPGVFRGLGVFANYTQVKNSDPELAYNNSPKTGSAGVSYRYRGFNVAVRGSMTSDTLISATTYREERTMLGVSAGYKLTEHLSLFMTGRNVLNEPIVNLRRDFPGYLTSHWHFGSNWSFGIKGVY